MTNSKNVVFYCLKKKVNVRIICRFDKHLPTCPELELRQMLLNFLDHWANQKILIIYNLWDCANFLMQEFWVLYISHLGNVLVWHGLNLMKSSKLIAQLCQCLQLRIYTCFTCLLDDWVPKLVLCQELRSHYAVWDHTIKCIENALFKMS